MSDDPIQTGRRIAPRLRLSLPGKFLAVRATMNCIVTNLSQTGVLIAAKEQLEVGENGYLRCGPIDHFVTVVRKQDGLNALEFDVPLKHDTVLQMRQFQETLIEREKAELMETARSWSQGGNTGRF